MSQETSEWLNQNVLVGFTDQRGHAWHYKESAQGAEPNHYPGSIPMGDVLRRLFHWRPIRIPLYVNKPVRSFSTASGETEVMDMVELIDRIAIGRDDTYDVFGVFKASYTEHDYQEWLLGNVRNILRDGEIEIGSAGLLRGGAQAWVSVEVPNTMATKEGVAYRPNLLACTSLDGTLATTYKRVVQIVVCDNTLSAGLDEAGQVYKVKHSKYSKLKLNDAASALEIVYEIGDDFEAEVERLCQWEITDGQWDDLLNQLVPVAEGDTKGDKRNATMATKKRDELASLYRFDERAATWNGTAFGVLQAFNTWEHHLRGTRGETQRVERNMSDVLTDRMVKSDTLVLNTLAKVCSN